MFQSTYLYKVRHLIPIIVLNFLLFQSTYLYKVRRLENSRRIHRRSFNPRTYIRYDSWVLAQVARLFCFNPRTYIRYDVENGCYAEFNPLFQSTYLYKVRLSFYKVPLRTLWFQSTYLYKVRRKMGCGLCSCACFNPRTYIRYDPESMSHHSL